MTRRRDAWRAGETKMPKADIEKSTQGAFALEAGPPAARWRVLVLYAASNALMQFEWLRFAPITDVAAAHYGVGVGDIGALSLLFPLLFVALALPTGRLIDRFSVRALLRFTVLAMAAGAALRIATSFRAVMAGQFVLAAVQPLVVSLISKLIAVWFPEPERLRATSIGTISLLVGPLLAFVVTPRIATVPMQTALAGDAAVLSILLIATFLLVPADPSDLAIGKSERWLAEIRGLLKRRGYVALLGLIFIGNGYVSALFTWLEPLLKAQDFSAETAGIIGLLILGGGLIGMALTPRIPDLPRHLPRLLPTALGCAALLTLAFAARLPVGLLGGAALMLGALVQGPLPIIVERVTELAGPARVGVAASTFWLAANAGAAFAIWMLSVFSEAAAWFSGVLAMAALLLIEALIASRWITESIVSRTAKTQSAVR